ncbi:MAG: FkbM family methyltransferase [Anaerolineae bacterium]|nr:FkbM family methyltransferase [Anaerolineae bacterium]
MKKKCQSRVASWLTNAIVSILPRLQTDRADLTDIYFCYRLLLGRRAEDEGWQNWSRHVALGMTASELGTAFFESSEFCKKHSFRASARIQTDDFAIYVDLNDAPIADSISQRKVYEPHVTAVMKRLLQPEHVFLDIGCSIGWFTLLAASIVREGKVIGVEPNQNNLQLLYHSIYVNSFDNIVIFPYAATDRSTLLQLWGHAAYGTVHTAIDSSHDYVQGVAIDDLLSDEARLDVVKIDIEGHEPIALQGMARTIHKHRPIIVTEFHPQAVEDTGNRDPHEYLESLIGMGYRLAVIELTGNVTDFLEPSEIMDRWRKLNQQLGTDGIMHLDILAGPMETDLHRLLEVR